MSPAALPDWLAPLLLAPEHRASDAYAIDTCGIPGIDLMERAGLALAQETHRALPAGPVVVLCGGGNNGGDGYIAARLLREWGREVRVVATADPAATTGDAAIALERLGGASGVLQLTRLPEALQGASGAIDALLGTGASGAPRGAVLSAIELLGASGVPAVACDLPSGLDADTGETPGAVVRAAVTVTFHRPSPGHLLHPGKAACGHLVVADIGIPPIAPIAPQIGAIRRAVLSALPRRDADSHKYAAGAVLVLAGSASYPGAAVLAVRGAQRAGAGYVTALLEPHGAALVHQASPEAVVVDRTALAGPGALAELVARRADAVVAGPGLVDPAALPLLSQLLRSDRPMLLDADGLVSCAGEPERLRRDAPLVITPHAGELARVLGRTSAEVQASRLASAQEAATRSGAVVVLKGDDTIVAEPGGRVAINDLAAPALATAGTGDVLAGVIGALLAAGVDAFMAAAAGVSLHAQAGRIAAARAGAADGVVAFDVAEALPSARGAWRP